MTMHTQTRTSRIARFRTLSVAGIATVGVAAATLTMASASAQAADATPASTAAVKTSADGGGGVQAGSNGYANNLDGWIQQSLVIMKAKGIPGSYEGLHRNIMRESSGNPYAQNNWDVNAQNGVPSKGLLQVIQPTFNAYHVAGTAHDVTNPVANITAAANYAAHRYGSIDNVNSAY
ncbi:transglycosylase SLT domain-containing protein [Streptomyces sp. NPDC001832]|uniref:transglycosylase SLT domain-containing protein n=1 Tax=Streptomyces sp. NPDC001832 TaxID=3154527 RepID=UPI003321FCF2